jgi:hypothetical protein
MPASLAGVPELLNCAPRQAAHSAAARAAIAVHGWVRS